MGAIAWIQAAKTINTTDKSFSSVRFQQQTAVCLDISLFSRIHFSYVCFASFSNNHLVFLNFFLNQKISFDP